MEPVKKSAELPGGLLMSDAPSAQRLRADSQEDGDMDEASEEIRGRTRGSTFV